MGHYVVFAGYDAQSGIVRIMDPDARNRTTIRLSELENAFIRISNQAEIGGNIIIIPADDNIPSGQVTCRNCNTRNLFHTAIRNAIADVICTNCDRAVSTRDLAATPQQPPVSTTNANEFEQRVFELTNIERGNHGLPPLQWDNRLGTAARLHSQDMTRNRVMGHTGSDGSSPADRISRAGFAWSRWAENVAWGQRTAEEAVRWWMNSPPHRANILDRNVTHLGVGFDANNWTQKFATGR